MDYHSDFLDRQEAAELYRYLVDEYEVDRHRLVMEVAGERRETDNYKILFATQRLIDRGHLPESVFGKSFVWEGPMAGVRERVEAFTGRTFEIGMCLYYPDGNHGAIYHFDQQTSGEKTVLPSLSLGEVREFRFRENSTGDVYAMDLADGSLLVMADHCQARYEHSLPTDPKYRHGRINITFREASFK